MSKMVQYKDGTRAWRENGELHRTDGPAIEYANGHRTWYQNDKLHRLDGPAIESPNGYCEWWVNGIRLPDNPTQEDILGALI